MAVADPRDEARVELYAAALTPTRADGSIDDRLLCSHASDLRARGCAGVALFGTTGEGQAFSVEERIAALDALLADGFPASGVLFGSGSSALTDVVELSGHAAVSGCTAVLVLPFFLFRAVETDGVERFYCELIERVGDRRLRVILYNLPEIAGVAVGPDLVERLLARYPASIAGVKDSSGDWESTRRLLASFPGLPVWVGAEPHLRRTVEAGGAGGISGLANLIPELLLRAMRAPAPGDQEVVERLTASVLRHPVIPAIKALVAEARHEAEWLNARPPLLPLPVAARAALHDEWLLLNDSCSPL